MMKRRDFSALSGGTLALAAMGLTPQLALAQGTPREGQQFRKLEQRMPTDVPAGKIEVIEFFRYSCPHCAEFDPLLSAWVARQPKDVVFKRVPVSFADEGGLLQRLYYTLEAMGLVDKLHGKVFLAFHVEKVPFNSPDAIANWVAKQGVDRAKFLDNFKSFSVSAKATRAGQMENQFRLEGVPTLAFGGHYISDGGMAGGMDALLKVGDFLVGEIRAHRL